MVGTQSRRTMSVTAVSGLAAACIAALLVTGATAAGAQASTCFGEVPTIRAVAGQETIGTSGPDVIVGTAGSDIIRGGGGADLICSGSGDDTIRGNDGADRINAGSGDDVVIGGKGGDTIRAGRGSDTVFGNKGDDDIKGQKGVDVIRGGRGDDTINGNSGDDDCRGGAGVDTITNCEITGAVTTVLEVVYEANALIESDPSTYWIVCLDDGTGDLVGSAPGVSAETACADLSTETAARSLLVEGPDPFEVCLDVDAGPETADVSGSIDGALIDESFSRSNSCGESDWQLLHGSAILPTPVASVLVSN